MVNNNSKTACISLDPRFLLYCQLQVRHSASLDTHTSTMGESSAKRTDSGCCACCGRCLSALPTSSLTATLLLAVGVAATCGSLLVGVPKATRWLQYHGHTWDFTFIVLVATLSGMVVLGLTFLLCATLFSKRTNKKVFNTTKKNTAARGLNVFTIVTLSVLLIAWLGVTLLLSAPVLLFLLLHYLYREVGIESINLKNYGIYRESFILVGQDLDNFYDEGWDVFSCFLIAFAGSLIVMFSLVMLLMSAAANSVHLREARYAAFHTYNSQLANSRTSIIDTRM